MRKFILLALISLLVTTAQARLGDTEAELFKRFGMPTMRSKHSIGAQGKTITLGPTYYFKQEDWNIRCDMIDGQCMRINYSKPGDWTEEQIKLVVNSNSQGSKWTETTKRSGKYQRDWRRDDGSKATWSVIGGFMLTWGAYEKAKLKLEEQARVESASKRPKI